MLTYFLKRLAMMLTTLVLLSMIVFAAAQVLPGNPGRAILGPFAEQSAVDAVNRELGTDKPLPIQYWNFVSNYARGDLGRSYAYRDPVAPILTTAFLNSLKLATVVLLLVVPLAVGAGVLAAINVGRPTDRLISLSGMSATVVPEFVSGIVLILVFGVWLHVFPITAAAPPGADPVTQIHHLILPAIPLVLSLFGYLARMARTGTIEALDSDYARTATLKGLPRRTVIFRHVLRNSLLPTIMVVANQTGYLIGGLIVVEVLFNYNGLGMLIFQAATAKDFPMLEAGVLVIGIVYMVATFAADMLYSFLNPRIRFGGVE